MISRYIKLKEAIKGQITSKRLFGVFNFLHKWMSTWRFIVNSDQKWIGQKHLTEFINEKFRKPFSFFTCILPDYLSHESLKEFWKNSHFENRRANFLRRYQNSLRQNSPKMMHFQAGKNNILSDYVSHESLKEFWKNSHFGIMRAGFIKNVKNHFGKLALKWCIFRHEKNIF